MKGPPPDPDRARRGTGNRPLPAERPGSLAVADVSGLPAEPPAHLDAPVASVWLELVGELRYVQGIKGLDAFALENLATMIAHGRAMARAIAEDGIHSPIVDRDGDVVGHEPNKMLAAYRGNVIATLRLMEQFGLTPAARLRLGVQALEGMTMAEQLRRALAGDE